MGLYLFIVLFFCLYILILENRYNNAFADFEDFYIVKIVSMKETENYHDKYIGKVLYGKNKNFRVYLYLEKDSNFRYGDILKVEGTAETPLKARNDKGFDYCKYLKTKKIARQIFVKKIKYLKRQENFISKIYDIKEKCSNIINDNFNEKDAEVLKALLLGDTSNVSEDIDDVFNKSNLTHILAISGLHVTYIVLSLELFLKRLIKNIKLRNLILIIFLIIFAIFVGSSPSVIRACVMTIMIYIGKIFLREKDFYVSFIVSLLCVLIINPYNIYSISMVLSFLGTLGIVLFSNFFQKLLLYKLKVKSKFGKHILGNVCVSISAQLSIFPIMWKCFGKISISFLVSNLLVSDLVAPILIIGYASLIFFPLRKIFVFIEIILVRVFNEFVLIASKVPLNQIYVPMPSITVIFLYYFTIFEVIVFYKKYKLTYLKCILNYKYLKNQISKHKAILKKLFNILIIVILINQLICYLPQKLRINFLDVRSRRLYNY